MMSWVRVTKSIMPNVQDTISAPGIIKKYTSTENDDSR